MLVGLAAAQPHPASAGAFSPAAPAALVPPGPPSNLVTRVGDQSVALHWDRSAEGRPLGYHVYRAAAPEGPFARLTSSYVTLLSFADLQVTNGQTYRYLVRATNSAGESADSPIREVTPQAFANDSEFLELVQQTAFDYFWYEANPTNGLVRDRSQTSSFCSIAANGFGLTAIGIGIDHGWITRQQGRERTLATLRTFWEQPQNSNASGSIGCRGWFYHFLDMNKATRYQAVELSSIDTALLLGGVLYARQYFDGDDTNEVAIRSLAESLYNRVDWNWMANNGSTLTMGWLPASGFLSSRWIGYNEGMLLYVLALGASTNPLPATQWAGWTAGYKWQTYYGYSFVNFQPLFGHQYSHCWIDFRYLADAYLRAKGITYFENSRRATLAQREYAIANPGHHTGYGANLWGLTASDGPSGYSARGAPPAFNDDGTISPTAAGGSIVFTPEFSIAMLRNLYDKYRAKVWTGYGFRDAFNLQQGWWGPDVLGIDQGPILIMIENYRTRRVWGLFMQNPEIQRGLQRAGFLPVTFAKPEIQRGPEPAAMTVTWEASTNHGYQLEYSPNLTRWDASATGFLSATSAVARLSWLDAGPPATVSAPADTAQRFYRVYQIGEPGQ